MNNKKKLLCYFMVFVLSVLLSLTTYAQDNTNISNSSNVINSPQSNADVIKGESSKKGTSKTVIKKEVDNNLSKSTSSIQATNATMIPVLYEYFEESNLHCHYKFWPWESDYANTESIEWTVSLEPEVAPIVNLNMYEANMFWLSGHLYNRSPSNTAYTSSLPASSPPCYSVKKGNSLYQRADHKMVDPYDGSVVVNDYTEGSGVF